MNIYAKMNRSVLCMYCLRSILSRIHYKTYSNGNGKYFSLEPDAVDSFTTKLIQRKTNKWETKKESTLTKIVKEKPPLKTINSCGTDIQYLNIENINKLLQNAIDMEDSNFLLDLARQCIKYKKCPSLSILIHVLSNCSQSGDKDMIVELTELCEKQRPELLEDNSHFQHYLAEAIWIKGNITHSLNIFKQVYDENPYLRRRIRLMLRHLIQYSVAHRSEAALLNILKFSEHLANTYKDYFPLACIWQSCFLSEWYSDQCLALQMLEKNEIFCKMIPDRMAYAVNINLRNNRTEVVYRLLEVLLKKELKAQYTGIVWALFDYQVRQGDVRGCLECLRWSLKNDIVMPSISQEKFLKLLIKNNVSLPNKKISSQKTPPTSFKF